MTEKRLTTNAGAAVVDNQNIMTAGRRGPALLQDVWSALAGQPGTAINFPDWR